MSIRKPRSIAIATRLITRLAAFLLRAAIRGVQAVDMYLAPSAFEERERENERKKLAEELDGIAKMRKYCDDREPVIIERYKVLQKTETRAAIPLTRTARGY